MTTEVFDLFLEGKVNLKQKGNNVISYTRIVRFTT